MTEETPSVEEIKERLKVDIPVEEEVGKEDAPTADVAGELKSLGQQFAQTLQDAWNSEEKQRFEQEVKEGVQSFVGEVDKVIQEARQSDAATKVKEDAAKAKGGFDASDIGQKTRTGFVEGLKWMSEELGKLADQFTPTEKSPPEGPAATDEETE